ncbi:PucR family transcriptional regulator [Amycolatopsis marina]|uniref:PucR family transcriptional regulator n=1 Tax=Amycolatopsis marina TaxID=490629 RepID=UPI001FE5BFAE|nr:PucR family transcriptional regulator [Amycolatopsis marina]
MTDSPNDASIARPERVDATYDSLLAPSTPPSVGSGDAGGRTVQLWALLPRDLAQILRPGVLDLADEVLEEIQSAVPDYARPLEGQFGTTITSGVQQAILEFVDRLGDPSAPRADRSQVFHRLGQHELHQGRSLDVLQTAYRVGARVAWRRMAEVSAKAGVPTSTLCLLAEAMFAYIDELSALSVEGQAAAQERAAGTLERRRRMLLDVVLGQSATPPQALAAQATAARWPIPDQVVAIALAPRANDDWAAPPLGDDVLMDLEGNAPCLVLPSPESQRRETIERALAGWRAAVGPEVPLAEAARSLRWARHALELVHTGVLPDTPVTWCADHLADLWLMQDPFLARELVARTLAPLRPLTGKQRERLSDTLLAWLETRGNVRVVSRQLAVHPQTVRSRVQELDTLFGSDIDDPQQRFELLLALRAQRAMRNAERSAPVPGDVNAGAPNRP